MSDERRPPKLALGPLLYHWPAERIRAFYAEVRGGVDTIYLGETVCARRRELSPEGWLGLGRELAEEGHEVVLSTLTLVEARSEAAQVRRLCENGELLVEANDTTALAALEAKGLPFVAGPALNVYHARALRTLCALGARRWVPPLELPGEGLAQLLAEHAELGGPAVETEVFVYGRMPLAYSARCFTARHYDRPKDDCGFACLDHPEGLAVAARDGEPFLVANGIQAQSAGCLNLAGGVPEMRAMGVSHLRLSPRPGDMAAVIRYFRRAARGEAPGVLAEPTPEAQCDGYWWGRPGREAVALGPGRGE